MEPLGQKSPADDRPRQDAWPFYERVPHGCVVLNQKGMITRVNKTAALIFGTEPAGLVNRTFIEFVDHRDHSPLKKCLNSASESTCEIKITTGDTAVRHARIDCFPERDRTLRVIRLFLWITDRSPLASTMAELKETQNKLKTVYQCIPVSTITWQWSGDDFILADYNYVADEITRSGIREFLGTTAEKFYWDRPDITEDLMRCFVGRQVIRREWPYRFRTTGEEAYFIATFAWVAPDLVLKHTQDITKRRQAEENLLANQKQLRSLALELSNAEERARRRIAGDLHDGVGQYLAISKLKLSKVRSTVNSSLRLILDDVIELISRAAADTRSLTVDLSPPVLYEFGLEDALNWLADRNQQHTGLRTDFEKDNRPKPLSDELSGFLYRAAAELLNNIVKHAEADHALIKLTRVDETIILVVTDDGKGYTPSEVNDRHARGFGLFSIRERLKPLLGRMEIDSEPLHGTTVKIRIPLATDSAQTQEESP